MNGSWSVEILGQEYPMDPRGRASDRGIIRDGAFFRSEKARNEQASRARLVWVTPQFHACGSSNAINHSQNHIPHGRYGGIVTIIYYNMIIICPNGELIGFLTQDFLHLWCHAQQNKKHMFRNLDLHRWFLFSNIENPLLGKYIRSQCFVLVNLDKFRIF